MPEITVKHNVKDAEPPKREIIPSGCYHATIVNVVPGLTKFLPALRCITIEYSIVRTEDGSAVNDEPLDKYAGRSVFQDYVLEKGTREFSNQQEAFRFQQLMAATACPHKMLDGGQISFNTDHLLTKGVRIYVTSRAGKADPADPKKPIPMYNNVDRIDSEKEVDVEDLV